MTPPPAAATAAARHAVAGRAGAGSRVAAPRPQRRISGPARPTAVPRPARRRQSDLPLGARALEWLRALPDHRLLDRLIGGRIWIVLLGSLLVGIVTMQLTLLRMNASIGRAVERTSALEQRNAALRLSISRLSDTTRIVALATQAGFVMPLQGSPRFLTASAVDAAQALRTMRVPDPNAAAAAAAQLALTSTASATAPTTTEPASATSTDPAATTDPTVPPADATATAPATATPAPPTTGTASPATGTIAPATTAAPATVAGGASAPVQGQG